jgi:GrpB-like predicted nucleotidyltransferase (UPF0157 family)
VAVLVSVIEDEAKVRDRIEIVAYDDRWRVEFRDIAARLRMALGDLAVRIDHIGSTSVPGLPAKDRIDIQVTVISLDAEAIAATLSPLGYALQGRIADDHVPPGQSSRPEKWKKLFFEHPAEQRPTNLHVRQAGLPNQRYALLFRDYLRTDPLAAGAYARVKEALARLHPDDTDAYYDVKDPVCDIIMAAAERWAADTGYVPGLSDA